MHQLHRLPLGGQQLHHLRQLRDLSDKNVREKHLKRSKGVSSSLYESQQLLESPVRRTVDAVVQERLQSSDQPTSTRSQEIVSAARQGIQTERSERPGNALRQPQVISTTRRIVAVRRRGGMTSTKTMTSGYKRRLGKAEADWIEKQLQYKTRVVVLEKECRTAWQTFFARAGSLMNSPGCVVAADVNKQFEELEVKRKKDVDIMKHQLRQLKCKVGDVQAKVEDITNGNQLFSELRETIDAMEAALAKFHQDQLQQFEELVLEEKGLENALAVSMEKMASWEEATPLRWNRGTRSAYLKPKLAQSRSELSLSHHDILIDRGQAKNNNEGESAFCLSNHQSDDRTVNLDTSDETAMVDRVRRLNEAIIRSGREEAGWDARENATFMALLVKCGLSDDVLLQYLSLENLEAHSQQPTTSNQDFTHEDSPQATSRCDFETRIARFLRKCMLKIVTQTRTSVRSHFEWYLRHLELVDEKKHVIQEWKRCKDEKRQQLIQCGFDVDNNVLVNKAENNVAGAYGDATMHIQRAESADRKKREETERLLEQWKREKKQKENEQKQRKRELQSKRVSFEAKRRQEQLDAKQKVLLYKLQKEQEAMQLDCSSKHRQGGATGNAYPLEFGAISSPTPNVELVARSHVAIESAKAKRMRLQQLEHLKQKRQQLPRRPEPKAIDEKVKASPKPVTVLNATAASKARDLSKQDIQRKTRRRERQGAHDAYFPGMEAIPDVKIKSFGHIPIQPRAVPAWRKNI